MCLGLVLFTLAKLVILTKLLYEIAILLQRGSQSINRFIFVSSIQYHGKRRRLQRCLHHKHYPKCQSAIKPLFRLMGRGTVKAGGFFNAGLGYQ